MGKVAVNRKEGLGAALVAVEKVAKLLLRCRICEQLYASTNPQLEVRCVLVKELVELYALILNFLIRSRKFLEQNIASENPIGPVAWSDADSLRQVVYLLLFSIAGNYKGF